MNSLRALPQADAALAALYAGQDPGAAAAAAAAEAKN